MALVHCHWHYYEDWRQSAGQRNHWKSCHICYNQPRKIGEIPICGTKRDTLVDAKMIPMKISEKKTKTDIVVVFAAIW